MLTGGESGSAALGGLEKGTGKILSPSSNRRGARYCGGFSSASRNAWPEAFFRLATQA
ncbi:hypothetical protein ABH927_006608 [Planotetraspora sp. GP83]